LADYNAGRTHVLRWNKGAAKTNSEAFLAQMDYPGTRKYAQNVMKQYESYKTSR
jgi:soluble lytic murein transglycosylase-like protein